jgi:hypothetical protein
MLDAKHVYGQDACATNSHNHTVDPPTAASAVNSITLETPAMQDSILIIHVKQSCTMGLGCSRSNSRISYVVVHLPM